MDTPRRINPTLAASPMSLGYSTTANHSLIPDPLVSVEADHLLAKLHIARLAEQWALRERRTLRTASRVDAARIAYLQASCNYRRSKEHDINSELSKVEAELESAIQQKGALVQRLLENKAHLDGWLIEFETLDSKLSKVVTELVEERRASTNLHETLRKQELEITSCTKKVEDLKTKADEKDKISASLRAEVKEWREKYEKAVADRGLMSPAPLDGRLLHNQAADDENSGSKSGLTDRLPFACRYWEENSGGVERTLLFSDAPAEKQSMDPLADGRLAQKRAAVSDFNESTVGNKRAKVTSAPAPLGTRPDGKAEGKATARTSPKNKDALPQALQRKPVGRPRSVRDPKEKKVGIPPSASRALAGRAPRGSIANIHEKGRNFRGEVSCASAGQNDGQRGKETVEVKNANQEHVVRTRGAQKLARVSVDSNADSRMTPARQAKTAGRTRMQTLMTKERRPRAFNVKKKPKK